MRLYYTERFFGTRESAHYCLVDINLLLLHTKYYHRKPRVENFCVEVLITQLK